MDTHAAVCCPGELGLGQLCESLYHTIYYTEAQVRAADDKKREEFCLAEVRQVVDALMSSYAALKGKKIWCEKTPSNLRQRELLSKVFPDTKFICLYRHCMDMVYSSIEAGEYGKMDELWRPAQVFDAWIEQTEQMVAFERENQSRCIRIKYESLVLQPSEELRRLFSFLDLEWTDALVEKIFTVDHEEGVGDVKVTFAKAIYRSSLGRGSLLKNIALSKSSWEHINALLRALDYSEAGPTWDKAVSQNLSDARPKAKNQVENIGDVFTKYIPSQMQRRKQVLQSVSGIVKFLVKGDHGGVWQVDLTTTAGQIKAEDGWADCTLTVASDDLLKMANGELNPGECFLQARLKVEGNADLAYRFGQAIFGA